MRSAGDVPAPQQGFLGLSGFDVRHRGAKNDAQFVLVCLQETAHFPGPAPEHVIGFAEQLAVQGDFGQRIQPVADQRLVLFASQGFVHSEAAPVFPVAFSHPLDFFLIVGHERVRDAPERQQIGMHAARDSRRQPLPASRLTELPGAA